MTRLPTSIDLFCGAGGFSEGFRQAGFNILAGIDSNLASAKTFQNAHPKAKFFCGEIQKISPKKVRKELKLKVGELDCLLGGPPCQAYSINNHNRGFHDKRAKLFRSYIRYVKEFYPKWLVIENVTGILSAGDGKAIKEITSKLTSLGYKIELKTLKSEDYGVPQLRRRVFIIGTRTKADIVWPQSHSRPNVTVHEAIMDLPPLRNGERYQVAQYRKKSFSEFQKYSREGASQIFNHETVMLSEINLKRLYYLKPGGSWREIPRRLLPAGMRRAKTTDHTKRYGRLSLDSLSNTILTKCDMHWGCYIHPTQDRIISVREAARFQSFPDCYVFHGTRTEQYIQIGNAVPPLVARAVATKIKDHLVKQKSYQAVCHSNLGTRANKSVQHFTNAE